MSAKAEGLSLPLGRSAGSKTWVGWVLIGMLMAALTVGIVATRHGTQAPVREAPGISRTQDSGAEFPAITGTGPGLVQVAGRPIQITGTGPDLAAVAGNPSGAASNPKPRVKFGDPACPQCT
jgi:hypothetical protein